MSSVDVELSGAKWFKSSRSQAGKECVEVAFLTGGGVGVRDSKNPTGPALKFTSAEWNTFTTGIVDGLFNRP
ncbi:transcriptional regulator [Nocardia sputorum]|uniref:Transcriptional regulator n=1 Tax=Nocardia sputorum TaxID=2984338 RepID=A0ABM8D4E5_9NOCA|nr:transcriptional regulator [Nocardia sputorum]